MSAVPIAQDRSLARLPIELQRLVDDTFVRSCELIEEYCVRLALALARATGLEQACTQEADVEQAMARAQLNAHLARMPATWILDTLAARGWMKYRDDAGKRRYCLAHALPHLDPEEIVTLQEAHDASCLPSYHIAALAAAHYPAVLRGELSGEQALFGAEGISAWVKYFSNTNPLYAISNKVGALAVEQAWPAGGGAILEIGAGLGSATQALLDRLRAAGRAQQVSAYLVSEISALFLKRAQRTLVGQYGDFPLSFAPLDIDRPFAEQGIDAGAYALVYGVNVLHVAHDLSATLTQIRRSLQADGMLVMAECLRHYPGMPLYPELVFSLLGSFRDALLVPPWRPNGGFLTPEQWTVALEANGFGEVRIVPDIARIREFNSSVVVGAIVARRA